MQKVSYLLIVILLLLGSVAWASDCPTMFAVDSAECEVAKSWRPENFTPPEKLGHSKSFRLIFHSISGLGWSSDGPEPRMKRLNEFSTEEFRKYVFKNCSSFGPKTLDRINKLRSIYPMFGFKLVQL